MSAATASKDTLRRDADIMLSKAEPDHRSYVVISRMEWIWALAFLLSLTMIGLQFPLGYILAPAIMFARYRSDRYDFLVMFTIFCGGYGFYHRIIDLHFDSFYLIFALSILGLILVKKTPILRKIIWLNVAYALVLLLIASTSDEPIRNQFFSMATYLYFTFFIFGILAFSGREFDFREFSRRWFPYAFITCFFYIFDSIIFGAPLLHPRDASFVSFEMIQKFYSFVVYPFSFSRLWPQGLYLMAMCIYPLARFYKLRRWQLLAVIAALAITRTFMFIVAMIAVYAFCRGKGKKLGLYVLLAIGAVVALYFVDTQLPYNTEDKESTLRIQSSVDQVVNLDFSEADDEDLAELGSTRGAQIYPKMELLYHLNREWLGFGFLSRSSTTNSKYIIENDLYNDPEAAEEVAIGVESMPFEVVLNCGYLGLIAHILFFVGLWWVIRKMPYSGYFVSVALFFVLIGITGLSGLIRADGLYMAGIAYASVILNNKRNLKGFSLPDRELYKYG